MNECVTVAVCDSWLVEDGHVRFLDRHIDRFALSLGCDAARAPIGAAVERLLSDVPRRGRWFPRIEWCGQHVHTQIRPAPHTSESVVLVSHGSDPRRLPTVKGPDLAVQERLREDARRRGADDALVVGPDGNVRETAFGSVVWWDDGVLFVPGSDAVLPGVTRAAVLELARADSVATGRADLPPSALATADEVWLLSALHGIRHVTEVDGQRIRSTLPGRRAVWQAKLAAAAKPISHWQCTDNNPPDIHPEELQP